jgi:hypothetical protein
VTNPKPHELNSENDELLKMTAGTYSLDYLRWYAKEHGDVPPEIEATSVDVTDRVLKIAKHGNWTLKGHLMHRYIESEEDREGEV